MAVRSAPGRQRLAPAAGRSATNLEIGRTCSSRDSEGIFNLVHGYYRYTSECYKLHTAVIRKKRILTRALKLIGGESTQSGSGDAAVGILLALARWLSWLGAKFFLFKKSRKCKYACNASSLQPTPAFPFFCLVTVCCSTVSRKDRCPSCLLPP